MIVAGLGSRREITADELEQAVRLAFKTLSLPIERLDAIATEGGKAVQPPYVEVVGRLAATLIVCDELSLQRVADRILTPSRHALEAKGVPSIAEAAALVGAGRNACLLGARVTTERATCAVAAGDGP